MRRMCWGFISTSTHIFWGFISTFTHTVCPSLEGELRCPNRGCAGCIGVQLNIHRHNMRGYVGNAQVVWKVNSDKHAKGFISTSTHTLCIGCLGFTRTLNIHTSFTQDLRGTRQRPNAQYVGFLCVVYVR